MAESHGRLALAPKPATKDVHIMMSNGIRCPINNDRRARRTPRGRWIDLLLLLLHMLGERATSLKLIHHEAVDPPDGGEGDCAGLPGRQAGLHALRQRAGGRGFIELVLRGGQRSQHAH